MKNNMKIIQVLETKDEYFKIDDLVRIKYNKYDNSDDYNWIGNEEIIGRIKSFLLPNQIILDISKEYYFEIATLCINDIVSIKRF